MTELDIHLFPCLKDNYGVLVRDTTSSDAIAIDAPDAAAVLNALGEKHWRLKTILTTHHHGDHTGGNLELKAKTGCRVIGPRAEAARIPGLDEAVGEDDTLHLGATEIRVIETPGHTIGHVTYWIPAAEVAFVGDTLFPMGCGRVFEGTPAMMWHSLQKIARLPAGTRLYCGHEYALANARFGLTIEPENDKLQARARAVEALRAEGKPTLPTRLDDELATNVFLRPHVLTIRARLGLGASADWRVFAEMRERKNKA
ncbi:MAG: hydroxyacylglutathione hydrolase [Hyphomicrobium sp.]